jgi:hypothetical protein
MRRNSLLLVLVALLLGLSGTVSGQITNIQISTPSTQLQNEEQVFYCPTDENIIIATWRDFRLGFRRCAIGRSTDGGLTWIDKLNDVIFGGNSQQTDPAMTVDRQGNFYGCYMDGGEEHSALVVIKSTDKGQNWTGPYVVYIWQGSNYSNLADKEFIACDRTNGPHDGNIYVVWTQFYIETDSSVVGFIRSTDGGLTFDDSCNISYFRSDIDDGSHFVGSDLFVQPIVGSDGAVYAFYSGYDGQMDECDSTSSLYMSKSTDGGLSWPVFREKIYDYDGIRCQVVDGNIDVFCCPAGDADITGGTYDGNIYISSMDFVEDGPYKHGEIFLLRTTDGGTTWQDRVRINDDPLGYDVDQFHPWLTVNQDGVIAVIFYDQRMDPSHYMFDVFAAYSFDGGETFTTNHRVTNVSSNPYYLGKAGTIAEYIGVTAFDDKITAVWTDLRNENQDVFAATFSMPFLEPRLLEVNDGTYLTSIPGSLLWGHSWHLDDVSYRLEVSSEPAFSTMLIDAELSDHQYTLTGEITDDAIYYWRVKAFRTLEADSSEFSDVWTFGVDRVIPGLPVLVSPTEGNIVVDYRPEFTWSVPAGEEVAPEYCEIEIADNDQFTGKAYYYHAEGLTETTYIPPEDLPGAGTYYWRINHYDLAGNESGYTGAGSFSLVDYICGDANGDEGVNIGDVVFLANHVFRESECTVNPPIGCPPEPYEAGDVNCDGSVNIGDAVYLGNVIFRPGSPGPCAACS